MAAKEHRILVTGAAGFLGQELVAALLQSSPNMHIVVTDTIEPPTPQAAAAHAARLTKLKTDLTADGSVEGLLRDKPRFDAVYLLHGLMSGGTEANLDLGYRVNLDSHRRILDELRSSGSSHLGAVVVFTSSLAVYGPADQGGEERTSEWTCAMPQSSYGAQKLMVETLLGDYSRRGLLDGRIVRLPTVVVRPGAPSAAASSFASGIVRESLKGERNVLPVGPELRMWVCSPKTVVRNLVLVKDVPRERFGLSRVVNLPGITVKVGDMLDALEAVAGREARDLVEERRDEKVEAIVGSWPAYFDISRAIELGMAEDVSLVETITDFAARLQ